MFFNKEQALINVFECYKHGGVPGDLYSPPGQPRGQYMASLALP